MSAFLLPIAVGWPGMVQGRPELPDLLRTSAALGIASLALVALFYIMVSRWHRRSERWRRVRSMSALLHGLAMVALLPALGAAQDPTPPPPDPAPAEVEPSAKPRLEVGAYIETFYSGNFGRPENGITAYRGFDNRHDSFSLSNLALDLSGRAGRVTGRLVLQAGITPETYYLGEPSLPAQAGVGASSLDTWKHVQQANIGIESGIGRGLRFEGGLFLSPIGPEGMAVKDNWQWSRSTLFYALPFYHVGARAILPVSEAWSLTAAAYNGWNDITDNNRSKSVSLSAAYARPDRATASLLYFGGVERPTGAPEGQPWRHLFDGHVTLTLSPRVEVQAHGDAGFEDSRFGRSSWKGGALALRVKALAWLYVAGRADTLEETVAKNELGEAGALFFPADRVSSLTLTLDVRPDPRVSVRLELRRDSASSPIYFEGGGPDATARAQTTLTLGVVAWF